MFPNAIRDNAYPILIVYDDDGNRYRRKPNRNTLLWSLLAPGPCWIRPLKLRNLRFRVNAIWSIWHQGGFLGRLLLMKVTHQGKERGPRIGYIYMCVGVCVCVFRTYHSLRIPKRIAELTYLTFVKLGAVDTTDFLDPPCRLRP